MYVVDFFKRLFRKNNWGVVVYLILNLLLLFLLFGASDVKGFVIVLAIYVGSLAVALSPLGEYILRVQTGSKPITRKEFRDRIDPLFNKVYEKAKAKDPSLPANIRLFINYDESPNAFATGRRTVCVTLGLLALPDEEIEAILAHEFAHLSHKDTDMLLIISVGNLIITCIFVFIRFVSMIVVAMASRRAWIALLFDGMLAGLMWVWTKIGILLVLTSSRNNEFEADKFALEIGYGKQLASALDKLTGYQPSQVGLWRALHSSHPQTHDRIGRLQDLGADYYAKI
ncbi:M48 family metalloprotease [Paenibacillus sp. NEAU-GSW1]|uniref:M48 family metalloprotease n=1 Tax=Paenibacillus sp. NEAU-GSW1 TaxID=2682486 RepID=UPI001564333D|nr:M48 family metalloprotease [Paenibacillus sp. NEAU-GSW1]